jgi:hypothetical protein
MKGNDCEGLVELLDGDLDILVVIVVGNAGNAYSSMRAAKLDCM